MISVKSKLMKIQMQQANSLPITRTISKQYLQVFSILASLVLFLSSCQKEVLTPADNSHLPAVTSMDPAYGQTDVDIQNSITVSFDKDLDPSKFLVNFTLQTDTTNVPGNLSISGNKATFIPDMPLNPDNQYIIAIDVTDNIPGARAAENHFMSVFYTKP